ncbi:hypothetical protein IFM89_015150 [Coptis chinensis]|uniref:Uncharacterized protein n=1 Tax=Coptis chinensis TaxID=261450 RepID=A0A835LRB5_9MAGN|nr:hypothetical protein IFM89_015150 [Coptis chinensis]
MRKKNCSSSPFLTSGKFYQRIYYRIPDINSFSNLQKLEVLDLSYTMLSGSVSQVLGGLTSIMSLNISNNFFTGGLLEIDAYPNLDVLNISDASNALQILDLSMNHFSGGLIVEGLTNCSTILRQLHVDFNLLFGHLPNALYLMSSLEQLSISFNNFSGQLSKRLSKLFRLKILVVFGNRFSGPLPDVFGNLRELEQFSAHSNNFLGLLPSSLLFCPMLQVLDLRNNSLTGNISPNFTRMPNLTSLIISQVLLY